MDRGRSSGPRVPPTCPRKGASSGLHTRPSARPGPRLPNPHNPNHLGGDAGSLLGPEAGNRPLPPRGLRGS